MTFPILTTKEGNGTEFINRDGTYNTTVTHWFPANEKGTTIECLYSNLNFKSMSSLRIVDSDNIDQNTTRKHIHNTYIYIYIYIYIIYIYIYIYILIYNTYKQRERE